MILRARFVLPVSSPPIEDGAVRISRGRIQTVGRWCDFSVASAEPVIDLDQRVLLPGLIDAHCHLDYTGMAGQIPPQKSFPDWIKAMLALKAGWTYTEYAQSWLQGAGMLVRSGTTFVADIEAVPELLPEVWETTPLRVHSFIEMTGIKSRRAPREILQEAVERIRSLPVGHNAAGLSPHAPYSTSPELLRLSAKIARKRGWHLTTHVAESTEEMDMFLNARGAMFDWLSRNERDMADCGLGSPIEHLERHGLLQERLLAVHVNYLAPGDVARLARGNVSVVHCPRSHAYFGHEPFPREALTAVGVNLCLGTDSLASVKQKPRENVQLNLFTEMSVLASTSPALSPEAIVRMATVNSASALGRAGEIGELTEGALADLIAIPFSGKMADVWASVVNHAGDVAASMIGGQWVIEPK